MIVENAQRFSAQLTRSDLFTRSAHGLRIRTMVGQIVEHLGSAEQIASMPIWISVEGSGGIPVKHIRLILKRQPCRFDGYRR